MVKKLRLKESVNTMPNNVYDSIALLGYTCALAANDFHHIHLCAEGDKFQEIHESADKYLADVRELEDICLELAKEGNIELMNETYALDILKDNGGSDWQVADKASYDFTEAFTDMSNILSDLTQGITLIEAMDGVTSDVISVMDEWARKFSKEVNYFINKKLYKSEDDILVSGNANESYRKYIKESNSKLTFDDLYDYNYSIDVDTNGYISYDFEQAIYDNNIGIRVRTRSINPKTNKPYRNESDLYYCKSKEDVHKLKDLANTKRFKSYVTVYATKMVNKDFWDNCISIIVFDETGKGNKVLMSQAESMKRGHRKVRENESVNHGKNRFIEESYEDSKAYKKLAEYDYVLDVKGNDIAIKWSDGDVYAKFCLVPPAEEDLADGLDEWLVYADGQLANNSFDYYPATYDQAVKCAIEYFWSHY